MANTKVVDAVKSDAPAGTTNVSVPIKMDGAMLAKALQAAQQQQAQAQTMRVNPAELIRDAAKRMEELYARFNVLRLIGAELNGNALTAPLPASLKIDDIAITFSTVKDGKESDKMVAHVKNVICVGDIAPLLSGELGTLILALQQESTALKETAASAEESCTKARKTWETNNPDRKVVPREVSLDPQTDPLSSAPNDNETPAV